MADVEVSLHIDNAPHLGAQMGPRGFVWLTIHDGEKRAPITLHVGARGVEALNKLQVAVAAFNSAMEPFDDYGN